MLYLDASALAKRYFIEAGSEAVAARFRSGDRIFTSILTFAEIHTAIGRKFRTREIDMQEFVRLRDSFQEDWLFSLNRLELDLNSLARLPQLVRTYSLKVGVAIHLSTAIWLKENPRIGAWSSKLGRTVEFGAADNRLAEVARDCGFQIFNPENEN
jgi:predicted nucleic acid-binding protein